MNLSTYKRAIFEAKVTGPHLAWTKEEAEAFLKKYEPHFRKHSFKASLIGSVKTSGRSEHDLDVLLRPIDEDLVDIEGAVHHPDFEFIRGDENYEVSTVRLKNGKIVDLFSSD